MHNFSGLHGPSIPPPPPEANGWGRHVAATLEHILVRLHYLERSHDEMRQDKRASPAPTTAPPAEPSAKDVWVERKETAKEVSTALRWGLGIVLLVLMAAKKLEIDQVRSLGKLFGGGA